MTNNDVLRRLRFALNLPDAEVLRLCGRVGVRVAADELSAYFEREGNAGFVACPDAVLAAFLDGLVLDRRGPRNPGAPAPAADNLDNNMILRKLRIALEFKEPDMLNVLAIGGMAVSSSELSALFRSKQHKHYRPAGDQLVRAFVKGLTVKLRGVGGDEAAGT